MPTAATPDCVSPLAAQPPAPDFARGGAGAPLITIAIPAYNRPGLLAEALASIARQKDFADFEVVVSDDGDLVESRRAIEASAVPTIRHHVNRPPLGPVANWNRCIELARGRWVTVLHEDDLLYPWFLKRIAARLREGLAAVAVDCVQGEAPPPRDESPVPPRPRPYAPVWFLKAAMTPFPGVVFPRDLALRLGAFDVRQGGLADYAFWYALARAGRVEVLDETAAFYRLSAGQWTEREWPAMLRRAHLLRLRVAREQLPHSPRLGRWIARFYTARMARSYSRRFEHLPSSLLRARRFRRIRLAWLPSGWVWALLKQIGRAQLRRAAAAA